MNVRKPVNYGTMYRELAAILAQNLPQMEEVYAIGKVINQRPEKGAAVAAAEFMQANFPDHTGFSPRNVRRMRDFYRTYENDQTLLRLAMKIGWTLNVVIMEAELTRDARKWYLEQAQGQHWSKKELVEMIRRKESRDEVNGKYEKAQKSMVYRRIVADTTPSPQGCVIGCALRVVIFCDIMTKNSLCAGGIPVDTIKEKLLTRIDERLFEYKTIPLVILVLSIAYVAKAWNVEVEANASGEMVHLRWVPWLAALLSVALIGYVIACIAHNRLPRAKRNTVAALFAIDAESAKLYNDVRYKLAEAFSEIQSPTKIAFSAVCIQAERLRKYNLQKVDDAIEVLQKCQCEFLIRVRYTVDDINNAEDFSLAINYGAVHPRFAKSVERVFAYDLSSLCESVRRMRFTRAEIIDTFEFTAQALQYTCRYLLGFICLLIEDNENARILLTELRQELYRKGLSDDFSTMLARMTNQRLYAVYSQAATIENDKFRENQDHSHLVRFKHNLDLANEIISDTFFYNINMAYYYVIEEKDGKRAKACIDKCRQSKEQKIWLYSDAFLSAYFGNAPQTIYSKYKKAFAIEYDLNRLAEYIEMVLEKEKTKTRLYFALGLLYEKIGDPIKMKKSFANYLEFETDLDDKTKNQVEQKMGTNCELDCKHDCSKCDAERLI